MKTIREQSTRPVFCSDRFNVRKDSNGNHYVLRLSDGQMVSFTGDVVGNRIFANGGEITDSAIQFWSVHDSWFM